MFVVKDDSLNRFEIFHQHNILGHVCSMNCNLLLQLVKVLVNGKKIQHISLFIASGPLLGFLGLLLRPQWKYLYV